MQLLALIIIALTVYLIVKGYQTHATLFLSGFSLLILTWIFTRYTGEPVPGLEESPTGAITAPNTCFRQVEFVGVREGAENPELAQAFVDFVLGETFQSDIPLNMWVFPANPDAELPEVFTEYAQVAEEPVEVPYAAIEENREAWVEAWSETVLR